VKIEKPDFTEPPSPLIQTDTDSVWASPSSQPSTSHEIIYKTPKTSLDIEESQDEGASYVPQKEVTEFSTKHFGSIASPYISAYAYRERNVDKDFGFEGRPTELLK